MTISSVEWWFRFGTRPGLAQSSLRRRPRWYACAPECTRVLEPAEGSASPRTKTVRALNQVGATIVHRVLTRLFMDRGVKLEQTYQLNFGGNTDFLNMLERYRLRDKKISKTNSVTSQLDYDMGKDNIHIGPSDHVPWLNDRKWCYIRMEGQGFGDTPLNVELKLEVWDSPNSAGVVIDAIRCCKIAKDRGLSGPILGPSSYFMKSPSVQYTDDVAREKVEDFIVGRDGAAPDV